MPAEADALPFADAELADMGQRALARDIATVRHGLSEAMVMADIANYVGDTPPFSSGYDDVLDACNAIWLAARAIDRIESALRSYANQVREECARVAESHVATQYGDGSQASWLMWRQMIAQAIRHRIHDEGKGDG